MIRYAFDLAKVREQIEVVDPRWFAKAAKRTEDLIKKGRYEEKSSIWSKTKPVFMRLQHNKCVFCERQFENEEHGTIEFDVEHFRPKSEVGRWPDPKKHPLLAYGLATGEPSAGYYWLAYEIRNYAASCKVCNTILKSSYFPIGGERSPKVSPFEHLPEERPFLCYPIGDFDDDPESIVSFVATTAVPAAAAGHRRMRGRIAIDFFDLNVRDQLHRERARMITILGGALLSLTDGPGTADDRRIVARMKSEDMPHAGCLRSFMRFWTEDKPLARRALDLCRTYAVSDPGTPPPSIRTGATDRVDTSDA